MRCNQKRQRRDLLLYCEWSRIVFFVTIRKFGSDRWKVFNKGHLIECAIDRKCIKILLTPQIRLMKPILRFLYRDSCHAVVCLSAFQGLTGYGACSPPISNLLHVQWLPISNADVKVAKS